MEVVEALRRIMDGFDPFYGSTADEETDDARRRALAEIARSKDYADAARGRAVLIERLIGVIYPQTKPRPPAGAKELLLAVLETSAPEVDRVMKRTVLLDRLARLVDTAADEARLRPAENKGEWGGLDQVYRRTYDDWVVTLGYFPQNVRHHPIYGPNLPSPLVEKKLAVSARYHKTEHYMVAQDAATRRHDLVPFLKRPEVDLLARSYGMSYELPPIGPARRSTTHTTNGGYRVMVETLDEELKRSPDSAEKLIGELSAVTIFHEDPGLSVHVAVEFPKGRPDVGQVLTLAFGADLFNLAKENWDDFKRVPPLAMAALEPLKE